VTQPDVALTDYAFALECVVFAWLLAARRSAQAFAFWFIVFFLSTAWAAAVAGTVHGFFEDPASLGQRILWPLSLLAVGVTSLAGARTAALLHFDPITALRISQAAAALFAAYCAAVLFLTNNFLVAIAAYLPATLFLGWVFLQGHRRTGRSSFMYGFAGICVVLVAAAAQQANLGIHPRYFNHNALYHVLQGLGFFLIFVTARDVCRSEVHA
jgi:hypothetical protein